MGNHKMPIQSQDCKLYIGYLYVIFIGPLLVLCFPCPRDGCANVWFFVPTTWFDNFFCSLVSKQTISFTNAYIPIMGDHINNESNLLPSNLHFMFLSFSFKFPCKPLKWHSCLGWHMVCFTFLCTTHGPFAPSMHMHQHSQGMASLNGILFKARKVDATFHFQLCIVMTSTLQHLLGTWYLPLPWVILGVKIFLK